MKWARIEYSEHIDLEVTLFSGQVFHFKRLGNMRYGGVLDGTLVLLMQQDRDVFYLNSHPHVRSLVERFLNLDLSVEIENPVPGLRFLTGDLYPTVFSFICSANNNLKRITAMVEYLYSRGERIQATPDGEHCIASPPSSEAGIPVFYRFPGLEALINIEEDLRANKFGYRAKYVCDAAKFLYANPRNWKELSSAEAREQLMRIKGIGRKVADCICLISLRQFHVVPIDTHIFRHSILLFKLSARKLTARTYGEIQTLWKERYGEYAGIVQLHAFKARLDARIANMLDE